MVQYNKAYFGSTPVRYIVKGGKIVKKVYKGSELIYKVGFDTFTVSAGTTNRAWTVPWGVEKIHIDCVASRGAHGQTGHSVTAEKTTNGGNGGRVQCDMNVTGGETLYITVGNIPTSQHTSYYNASDIKIGGTAYSNRVLVAGGGGSGCFNTGDNSRTTLTVGANGGGTTGASSSNAGSRSTNATGGTQTAGGTGNASGSFGLGGAGGGGSGNYPYAGAGGAGWYGGGGGRSALGKSGGKRYKYASGGGGGSSYANTSRCSAVTHTQGYRNGAGYITISYVR